MADYYKDAYPYSIPPANVHEELDRTVIHNSADKTARFQKKTSRTTIFDFGAGPYTVEQFTEWLEELKDYPPGAQLHFNAGDSQRDGAWLKITVQEG